MRELGCAVVDDLVVPTAEKARDQLLVSDVALHRSQSLMTHFAGHEVEVGDGATFGQKPADKDGAQEA